MSEVLPVGPVIGGMLIGLAASALLFLNGRIAGVSGIVGGLVRPRRGDVAWRVAFVAGLASGGALLRVGLPGAFDTGASQSPVGLAIAGLLVGFGTATGNGCTSGHGVCGLARRSPRSVVATATFMGTAIVTVLLLRRWA